MTMSMSALCSSAVHVPSFLCCLAIDSTCNHVELCPEYDYRNHRSKKIC